MNFAHSSSAFDWTSRPLLEDNNNFPLDPPDEAQPGPGHALVSSPNVAHPGPNNPEESNGERTAGGTRARSRRRDLDWDNHKESLKQLYLIDNKKLEDIRRIMNEDHSFEATCVHLLTKRPLLC